MLSYFGRRKGMFPFFFPQPSKIFTFFPPLLTSWGLEGGFPLPVLILVVNPSFFLSSFLAECSSTMLFLLLSFSFARSMSSLISSPLFRLEDRRSFFFFLSFFELGLLLPFFLFSPYLTAANLFFSMNFERTSFFFPLGSVSPPLLKRPRKSHLQRRKFSAPSLFMTGIISTPPPPHFSMEMRKDASFLQEPPSFPLCK